MLDKIQNPLTLVGRLLLASLFVSAGFSKLAAFSATVGYISSGGLPMPEVGAVLAIVVEIIAGMALVAGIRTRVAALVLAVFTVAASLFSHNYWTLPADQQMVQQLLFFKNIAVVGGLLSLAAWGGGSWSVDARRVPTIPVMDAPVARA